MMDLTDKEFTDEYLDALMSDISVNTIQYRLASALQAERAKPKVWAGAPDGAIEAFVRFKDKYSRFPEGTHYTRELPKTRADELARDATMFLSQDPKYILPSNTFQIIKRAIMKAQAEWEAGR